MKIGPSFCLFSHIRVSHFLRKTVGGTFYFIYKLFIPPPVKIMFQVFINSKILYIPQATSLYAYCNKGPDTIYYMGGISAKMF